MERVGTIENKTRTRIFSEGNFRGHTDYLIESEIGSRPAPQAFLVHQAPGWVLPVHFHLEEQFQVVTRGSGVLGQHSISPLTVHYTSRESGYGPLVAGVEGLDYLTLRAVTDPGAWYLPDSRDRMRRSLKRHQVTLGPISIPAPDDPELGRDGRVDVLLVSEASGLAAWLMVLPPAAQLRTPAQADSGGRFHVVMRGGWDRPDRDLGPGACVWRDPGDAEISVVAGARGLVLLVLQFPSQALASTAAILKPTEAN
jgi:hypothetical protein